MSEPLSARTRNAVAAAAAAARDLGLAVGAPRVLHDAFSMVVHLAPSPIVARVPVVLPPWFGRDALLARQRREVALVAWLEHRGQPVVRPSPLVPPAPVERDGFAMTFWELVELDPTAQADYVADAPLAAPLHTALRTYPGDLPFLAPVASIVPEGLRFLERHPELLAARHRDRARREWEALEPVLGSRAGFAAAFPHTDLQPIHGDSPAYNLLRTTTGMRYADFEDACLGPVEWDLALHGPEALARYDEEATRVGTRPLDRQVQGVMDAARMLQLAGCAALFPALPMLAEALAPFFEQWHAMPFAGGMVR